MTKAAFATLSRHQPAAVRTHEEGAVPDRAERARALARRFRHDPLLGDREARLAAIRRRWYGWEESSAGRLDRESGGP